MDVDAYLGEIRMFGFGHEPNGWMRCDGSLYLKHHYQALASLLGNTFGGDDTHFAVPDLRVRTPVGVAKLGRIGVQGGAKEVALTEATAPPHLHLVRASGVEGERPGPGGNFIASAPKEHSWFVEPGGMVNPLSERTVSAVGGAAHKNMQPYLAVPFCIAFTGTMPD